MRATVANMTVVNMNLAKLGIIHATQEELFRTIEGADVNTSGYNRSHFRQLVAIREHLPDAENVFFPRNKHDFVLAEVPHTWEPLTPAADAGKVNCGCELLGKLLSTVEAVLRVY